MEAEKQEGSDFDEENDAQENAEMSYNERAGYLQERDEMGFSKLPSRSYESPAKKLPATRPAKKQKTQNYYYFDEMRKLALGVKWFGNGFQNDALKRLSCFAATLYSLEKQILG